MSSSESGKHSYGQILKSSVLIGGSSLLNILIGMVRTKVMALLLGPAGVGLFGLFGAIIELTQHIGGMGVNSSGVRQIAEAAGSRDAERVAKTAQILRRTSILLGLLGAMFLLGFAAPVAKFTFGDETHTQGVAILSLAVFFNLLAAGQGALLQGLRKIPELAKISLFGALAGTLCSIPIIYFYREAGVASALVAIALMSLLASWWYRRQIKIGSVAMSEQEISREQAILLKLGFAFMSSGLLMTGATYLVRMIVVRQIGFDAAGLYQSAWTLGGLYVGFILQAMGSDFYPRLTGVAQDNKACNRIVNEQAHVSLLLAGPGVLATLALAPLFVTVFYSAKFAGSVELLRWLCLGMALRVVSWPMGFVIIAKNVQSLIILTELAWTIVYLGLAWWGVNVFRLNGVGIAFFGSYIFHVIMIYIIVQRLTGFRWTVANREICVLYLALILVTFASFYWLPAMGAVAIGLFAVLLSAFYSLQTLLTLVAPERLPKPIFKVISLVFPKMVAGEQVIHLPLKKILSLFVAGSMLIVFTYFCWPYIDQLQDFQGLEDKIYFGLASIRFKEI